MKLEHAIIRDGELRRYRQASGIREVIVPEGVHTIGGMAFYGCDRLTSIRLPSTLRRIEQSAFSRCRALSWLDLPDGVEAIGDGAFSQCTSLREIGIPPQLTSVGRHAFRDTPWLAAQETPLVMVGNGVVCAWQGKEANVVLPNGAHTCVEALFDSDRKLRSLVLPEGVRSISKRMCRRCPELTTVKLPESLTVIEDEAFAGCVSLKALHFPAPPLQIGADAIPAGCVLTFETAWGAVTITLPMRWRAHADERLFLAILQERDPAQIEALFRTIRQTEMKLMLGIRLAAAYPGHPYFMDYVRRVAKAAVKQFAEAGDTASCAALLALEPLSQRIIEELIVYASEHSAAVSAQLVEYKRRFLKYGDDAGRMRL